LTDQNYSIREVSQRTSSLPTKRRTNDFIKVVKQMYTEIESNQKPYHKQVFKMIGNGYFLITKLIFQVI